MMATIKSEQLRGTEECMTAVVNSIAELVTYMAKAMKIRQDEYVEFDTVSVNNATTSKLLFVAINRLNKFFATRFIEETLVTSCG